MYIAWTRISVVVFGV